MAVQGVALLTELSIVRFSIQENTKAVVEAIKYNAERVDGLKTGMLLQPEPMTSAYNAFLPKIGLLGLETLRPAMYAYLAIETAWSRLVLRPDIEPIDGHLSIGWKYIPELLEMWGNLIPDIDKAIVALGGEPEEQRRKSVCPTAPRPRRNEDQPPRPSPARLRQ